MSQTEVLEILIKNGDWMSTKQISKCLDIAYSTVNANLNRLFDFKEVDKKRIIKNHAYILWKAK